MLTNEISERERAHRVVGSQLHAAVDVLRARHALHEREESLVDHRHQQPVYNEACAHTPGHLRVGRCRAGPLARHRGA